MPLGRSAARALALVALLPAVLPGCSTIHSSSVRTANSPGAYTGAVTVRSLEEPVQGQPLGIVQTSAVVGGRDEFPAVIAAFAAEAAAVGGDLAKIDRLSVTFEIVTVMVTQSYSCGTQNAPRTCTRTVPRQQEVATLNVVGRSFRTSIQ